MTDISALRAHAAELRRAADRFSLIRLRLGNVIARARDSDDADVRAIARDLHEHWTAVEFTELGRIATGLRTSAKRMEGAAIQIERSGGRRLGGYAGAGFLGRGDDARRKVQQVARFVGSRHGAGIGWTTVETGSDLSPDAGESFLPHPSHTLGAATPGYFGATPDYSVITPDEDEAALDDES